MYKNWTWFHTLVDLLEMILAKSDKRIAKNYDVQLLTDANDKELGNELRLKLQEAIHNYEEGNQPLGFVIG